MKITELLVETNDIVYQISSPSELTSQQLEDMSQLISSGQEVTMSVVNRNLKNAVSIAYAYDNGIPVGVIVLKNPVASYRTKVFNEAGVPELASTYQAEIGYTYVLPEYRTRGVGVRLCRVMVNSISSPIYATTREQNTTINKLLKFAGFNETGDKWQSDRGNYNLILWTKG